MNALEEIKKIITKKDELIKAGHDRILTLEARVKELEGELVRVKGIHARRVVDLVEKSESALHQYGEHRANCRHFLSHKCTCGLADALKGGE